MEFGAVIDLDNPCGMADGRKGAISNFNCRWVLVIQIQTIKQLATLVVTFEDDVNAAQE